MIKMLPLLSMFSLSFAYADDQPSNVFVEIDAMGLSDHSNHYAHYNQVNPGLGVDMAFEVNPKDHAEIVVSMGRYKDSYSSQADYIVVGPRWLLFGDYNTFHATFAAAVGMYNGSGNKGIAVVPCVSIGWKWIDLCAIGTYDKDNNGVPNQDGSVNKNNCASSMIGVFLKFRVLDLLMK